MRSSTFRRFSTTLAILMLCGAGSRVPGDEPRATWNPKATREYLDARAGWWLDWPIAAKGQGTACVSCHTTMPYAIALPALAKVSGLAEPPAVARRVLAGVRTHVERWDELVSRKPGGADALAPISGANRRESALDTEAVLNALILVANDPPDRSTLSDAASRALDIMWVRQRPDGAWRWLEFGLQPWEKDGDYYGAALAAVAAGTAGTRYPRHQVAEIKQKTTALRDFLRERLAAKPLLHNSALGLWAGSHLTSLFTEDEKKSIIADLFAVQCRDGGWSMRDLGKSNVTAATPGWEIVGSHPPGAVSDGYATGLIVLALKRAGVSSRDERLRSAVAWLSIHQAADGTWPTVYVNKDRDPKSNVGKFNIDAGAAFALLALSEAH
jgi:squalene-hopene/tetraprenyl-beta-curcumene cyclase